MYGDFYKDILNKNISLYINKRSGLMRNLFQLTDLDVLDDSIIYLQFVFVISMPLHSFIYTAPTAPLFFCEYL